jgi:hypothetical protein
MKQTATEWLFDNLDLSGGSEAIETLKQAKKIEKKQIMEAWLITKPTTFNGWKKEFEQYYNETFNK